MKEACRDMRTLRPIEQFVHDFRFGARLLARGRGFTGVAVVSLALGIGASSSIVSSSTPSCCVHCRSRTRTNSTSRK